MLCSMITNDSQLLRSSCPMNGLNLFSKIIHKEKIEQLQNRTWELFWATGWLSGIMTTASQMPKEVDWWYWETTHDRKWYPLYRVYLSWKGEHELRITTCCFRDPTWVAGCSWPRGLVPGFDASTIRLHVTWLPCQLFEPLGSCWDLLGPAGSGHRAADTSNAG